MKKVYLIRVTWQWATLSNLHTAYFYAETVDDILARLNKIRRILYWKEPPKRIGDGMSGQAILFTDYYVREIEL
jgi:hypothetical protein